MTSKFKCPLCNHELYQTASECLTYCCLNKDCPSDFKFAGSKEIWQALIQSQQDLEESQQATLENAQTVLEIHKDLEITRKALDVANEKLRHCVNITVEELDELKGDLLIAWNALLHFSKDPIAIKALEQIEHKE